MSQASSCPVTCTVVPSSRRHASRTVANASGSRSSSAAASSFFHWVSSSWKRRSSPSRSAGSAQACLAARTSSSSFRRAPVRSSRRARNFAVCALSSSSVRSLSRSSSRWMASTDRLDALPLPFEPRAEDRGHECLDHAGSKYNRCLVIYSATASGTQYRMDRPSLHPAADLRGGDVDGRHLDDASDQGSAGHRAPGRANTTISASRPPRPPPASRTARRRRPRPGGARARRPAPVIARRAGYPPCRTGPAGPARPAPPRKPG